MADRNKQGLNGAGAEEPPMASGGAGGSSGKPTDLADAIQSAAKAEGDLEQATSKRQRLNLNDPAVIAAKAAEAAVRSLIDAEQELGRAIASRQESRSSGLHAGGGGSSGSGGVDRRNDLLDEAMGASSSPRRNDDPADSRTQEAIRSERELADLMRERLELARTLAGQPSVPSSTGTATERGYSGPTPVGSERPGGSTSMREAELEKLAAKLEPVRRRERELDISDARLTDASGLQIHDPRRAAVDRRRMESEREEFQRQLDVKDQREAARPGLERFASRATAAASFATTAVRAIAEDTKAATAPFMTDRQRLTARIPLGETLQGASDRLFHGVGVMQASQEQGAKLRSESGVRTSWRGEMYDARQELEEAKLREAALTRVPPPPVGYFDPATRQHSTRRETLDERQRYELAMRQQPARERTSAAEREYDVAMRRLAPIEAREAAGRKREDEITLALTGPKGLRQPGWDDAVNRNEIAGNIQMLEDERSQIVAQRNSNIGVRREARERVASTRYDRDQALMGEREIYIAEQQRREGTARSQAQRLGMAGIDGRMNAILNKQIIDQIGPENATGAMLQNAAALFPETIRQQAEQAGQRVQPGFQKMAPDEYQDSVSAAAKKVDEGIQSLRDDGIQALAEKFGGFVDAVMKFVSQSNDTLKDRIDDAERRMKNESELRNR